MAEEKSIAGSPAYIETIAGGGTNQTRIEESRIGGTADVPAWQVKLKLTCSSAVEGSSPEVFWVPQEHNCSQWLQILLSESRYIVGLAIETNHSGSIATYGRGFHATEVSVSVSMLQAQTEQGTGQVWRNVETDPGSSTQLAGNGGTIKFKDAVKASCLRIFPKAWEGGGIGMRVFLLVESFSGPSSIGFRFTDVQNDIAFDPFARELLVLDNLGLQQGGMSRLCVSSNGPCTQVRTVHVPRLLRNGIMSGQHIRGVAFGPSVCP